MLKLSVIILLTVFVAGCGLLPDADRDAYKRAKHVPALEEPPEIVLPKRDASFNIPDVPDGAISKKASDKGAASAVKKTLATSGMVVPAATDIHLQRDGQLRWLTLKAIPEQLWPSLLGFWKENQTDLVESDPKLGAIKTDWIVSGAGLSKTNASNNAFLSGDAGDIVLRDQFRMRLERTKTGSNVYITHIGAEKIKDADGAERWKLRPSSPELEAGMLTKLQQYLGNP